MRGVVDLYDKDEWPTLGRLVEGFGMLLSSYEGLSDEDLVHCLDRELETGDNPHVILPGSNRFQP